MKSKNFILLVFFAILSVGVIHVARVAFTMSPTTYDDEYFNIETYSSYVDKDNDGINDQLDILQSAKEYVATNPKYKSNYYDGGYPDDGYGVCSDVVAFALKGAGYDLMELVNEDILTHREQYDIDTVDKNIDFRRVKNLKIYFDNHALSLTTNVKAIEEWQGGDIVVFEKHIGIISNNRNKYGVPYVIHHANGHQKEYEQDILSSRKDIVGHYRMS